MRILSLVRQVPDAEESVKVRDSQVDLSSTKLVVDTMDEYGVEEALRLREKGSEIEVVVVSVGTPRAEDALRTALAIGADRAILVETAEKLDVIAVSKVIADIATKESADLIFCGGQQADWDSQGLGPALAERLHWPLVAWTTSLELRDGKLVGTHDVDEGSEAFVVSLPCVITTQQGLNEPRYPTLPNIMKAKRKELRREQLEASSTPAKVKILSSEVQTKSRLGRILDGTDAGAAASELVNLLRNEAKVIS